MTTTVRYAVARNCMKMIFDGGTTTSYEALGIRHEDFNLVSGSMPWVNTDRPIIVGTLNLLTHGSLDVLGLPRIEVPAEYRAAIITAFVHPVNIGVACRWLETGPSVDNVSEGGSLEPVTANQLFSLCCKLYGDSQEGRASFDKTLKRAIRDVEGHPDPVPLEEEIEHGTA